MKLLLLLSTVNICLVTCLPPPHPAVVAVRQQEELLPQHLRSPALHNRRLQEILELTSVLHKGEMPVFEREADAVSRREIYNILTHAGLVPRVPGLPPSNYQHRRRPSTQKSSHTSSPQHFDDPFLSSADLLQYL